MVQIDFKRLKTGSVLKSLIKHTLLMAFSISMLLPFIWMLSTALKEPAQVNAYPPVLIPNPIRWSNFPEAFSAAPFLNFFINTTYVSLMTVVGTLSVCSLGAFAFARLNFKRSETIFNILLFTMMIPYTVRVIPLYSMMRAFNWIDTHWALIVPPLASNVYGLFLLRQFMKSIPIEMDESARIDGASSFMIFRRIILPLSKAGMATLSLFIFKTSWNQYLPALVFINTPRKNLITVGLTIFQGEFETAWNLMMAGAVVAVLPVILIYLAMQKFFVKGIATTGIKG
jgi:multiple sugar transport system permease protein